MEVGPWDALRTAVSRPTLRVSLLLDPLALPGLWIYFSFCFGRQKYLIYGYVKCLALNALETKLIIVQLMSPDSPRLFMKFSSFALEHTLKLSSFTFH